MKAMVLSQPAAIDTNPLVLSEVKLPEPASDEVLLEVIACGICRTDLHVVEGELSPKLSKVIPGHQVVGQIVRCGNAAKKYEIGACVGIPWLHRTCGRCEF